MASQGPHPSPDTLQNRELCQPPWILPSGGLATQDRFSRRLARSAVPAPCLQQARGTLRES